MKTMKELWAWAGSQQALNQDLYNYLTAPVIEKISDTRQEKAECEERIEKMGKLAVIFENYDKFEKTGLSDGIDLKTLEKLRDYCRTEKEIYVARVYGFAQDKEQFYRVYMESEYLTNFQDAELALIMLIVTEKSR